MDLKIFEGMDRSALMDYLQSPSGAGEVAWWKVASGSSRLRTLGGQGRYHDDQQVVEQGKGALLDEGEAPLVPAHESERKGLCAMSEIMASSRLYACTLSQKNLHTISEK
jgi:hypothetical protein